MNNLDETKVLESNSHMVTTPKAWWEGLEYEKNSDSSSEFDLSVLDEVVESEYFRTNHFAF